MGDDGDDMMVPDPVEVEQAEAAPLPNYDRRSGRVSNAAGMYIGAVRHTKVGEPGHMVCVYCSRHKCSRVFRAVKEPSEQGILRWLGLASKRASHADHMRDLNEFAFSGE